MNKNHKEMSVFLLWPFVPHHYIILRSFSTWFSNNVIDLTQRVEAPYISIKMTNWQIWLIHRNIQLTIHNNQLDFKLLYVTNKNNIPNTPTCQATSYRISVFSKEHIYIYIYMIENTYSDTKKISFTPYASYANIICNL